MPRTANRTTNRPAAAQTTTPAFHGTRVVAIADDVKAGRWSDAEAACRALALEQPKLRRWATGTADAASRQDALATIAKLVHLAAASDAMARAA